MKKVLIIFSSFLIFACQKPASEGRSSSSGGGGAPTAASGEAVTDCGVVYKGNLYNPVKMSDGKKVRVRQVYGANLLAIEGSEPGSGGPQLLKLHGVGSASSGGLTSAKNTIQSLASSGAMFYKATEDCDVILQGGGRGTIGHLINSQGISIGEALVTRGQAAVDANDACGGEKIGACYNALKGQNQGEGAQKPMGAMRDFLWKPVADHRGVLVVLEKHCNTRILVNGVELESRGASNGRCNTTYGRKVGCGYGSNIKVEVIDKSSGRPYTYKGDPYVRIPNGCQRFEFK